MNPIDASTDNRSAADLPLPWIERLRDGSAVRIRPLERTDTELEREFLERCSPQTRRFRFLGQVRPSRELAERLTRLDRLHDVAFIATTLDDGDEHAIAIGRYSTSTDGTVAECAITVRDDWQGHGLGTALMRHLIEIARAHGVRTLSSIDAAENEAMRDLARFLGFRRDIDPDDPTLAVHTLSLQ